MFLYLPRDVIRSTVGFRFRVHTLRFETATWFQSNSPTCDLCGADDVQDEQHVLLHCANPHVISLRRKYAPLFPPTGAHDVSTFLSQNNNKLYFFLHELIAFYEQASSRTSWLKALLCKPCKPCKVVSNWSKTAVVGLRFLCVLYPDLFLWCGVLR